MARRDETVHSVCVCVRARAISLLYAYRNDD